MVPRRYLTGGVHGEEQRYDARVATSPLPLPTSQRSAIGLEALRTVRAPFENLIVAASNGGVVLLAWFLFPPAITGLLWNPHGPDSLAVALLVWMVSDVPATNVFGSDAARMRAALANPRQLLHMARAKALALWALAAVVCVPIDLASGLHAGRSVPEAIAICSSITLIPLAVLGCAAVVGAMFPYHPIALRERFENDRKHPRRLLRWGILVTAPYVVVPLLGQVAVIGFTVLERLCSVSVRHTSSTLGLVVLVAVMAALSWIMSLASYRALLNVVARRRALLEAQLDSLTL